MDLLGRFWFHTHGFIKGAAMEDGVPTPGAKTYPPAILLAHLGIVPPAAAAPGNHFDTLSLEFMTLDD